MEKLSKIEQLPKRKQLSLVLKSNIVSLNKQPHVKFHQYEINFPPTLPSAKQRSFTRYLEAEVLAPCFLGTVAYYDQIYSKSDKLAQKLHSVMFEGKEYAVKLKLSKVFEIKASEEVEGRRLVNKLMKIMLSRTMTKNGFKQIGKTSAFINPKDKTLLKQLNIYEYKGYEFKINMREQLLVVPASRLIRVESVLDQIKRIYLSCSTSSKEEKRAQVADELEGTKVITNYGQNRGSFYKISKVDFSVTVLTPGVIDKDLDLKSYYKAKYGVEIQDTKQPLLIAVPKNKSSKDTILLVPQLCLSVGLGKTVSKNDRAKITKTTTKSPTEVHTANLQALQIFNNGKLGNMIDLEYEDVQASQINFPAITGGSEVYTLDETGSMKILNRKLSSHKTLNRQIKIKIYFSDCSIESSTATENIFTSISKGFVWTLKIQRVCVSFKDSYLQKMKDSSYSHLIILPRAHENLYTEIKKHTIDNLLTTQVMLESKLKGIKNVFPYMAKVLIQILAKNGVPIWISTNQIKEKQMGLMLMGVTMARSKVGKLAAVVNSLNSEISSYFSSLKPSVHKSQNAELANYIMEAVASYKTVNGKNPTRIIIMYQDQREKPKFHEEINFSNIEVMYKCQISFIAVNDASKFRFFQSSGGKIDNPPVGTLIQDQMQEEFHLITESNPIKMTRPVTYTIIKQGKFSKEQLERLMFSECFNYYNWNGPVKIPSCLQYCKKLLTFASLTGIRQMEAFETLPYL